MEDVTNKIKKFVHNKERLIYIDPSEFAGINYTDSDGKILDNISWNPEDLSMNVDLQVIIPSNDDCGQIDYHITENGCVEDLNYNGPGKWVSFMGGDLKQGNNEYQTTDYTNISFTEIKDHRVIKKEDLGITSIDINFDAHFYPQVTINMTDVRGQSLLVPSEVGFDNVSARANGVNNADMSSPQSFFNALFRFPYPRFLLSVKGFYGSRITFTLAVSDFKNTFNSETGDFDISIKFIGYIYGLYTDLPLDLVITSPYYNSDYWESNPAFRYVDNNASGKHIYTFTEFKEKLETLSESISANDLMHNSEVAEYNKIKEQGELLTKIKEDYEKFYGKIDAKGERQGSPKDRFIKKFKGEIYTIFIFQDGCFSFVSDNNRELYKTLIDDLNKYFKTYEGTEEEFKNGIKLTEEEEKYAKKGGKTLLISSPIDLDLSKVGAIIPPELYLTMNAKDGMFQCYNDFWGLKNLSIKGGENGNKELLIENNTSIEVSGTINKVEYDNANDNDKEKYKGEPSNCRIIIYKHKVFLNFLTREIENLEKKENNFTETASDELVKIYSDALGFKPSVENIYRMLFAHIDCFMDYFYKAMSNIASCNGNKRRSSKVLGLTPSNSDMRIESDFVAPFPAYYEGQGENKIRMAYPGNAVDNVNLQNIDEVALVNNIINGIRTFNTDDGSVFNSVIDDAENIDEIGSICSPMTIFRGNDSTPWSNFKISNDNSLSDATEILYTIICEYLITHGLDSDLFHVERWTENRNKRFDKWLDNEINIFKKYNKDKIKDVNNLASVFYNITNMLNGWYYDNLKTKWSSTPYNNKLILPFENTDEEKDKPRLYVTYKNLPIYFDTAFQDKKIEGKTLLKDEDPLSISSMNGVLSRYDIEDCETLFKNSKEGGVIKMDEAYLSYTEYYDVDYKSTQQVSYVTRDIGYNNLYYVDNFKENILKTWDGTANIYTTQQKFIEGESDGDVFYPFVIIEPDENNDEKLHNLFDLTTKDEIFKELCNQNYYSFGYFLLSKMVNMQNFKENISKLFPKYNKKQFIKIDKLELLLLGGYLYRLKNDNGNFFLNYKKNKKLGYLGNDIKKFIEKKEYLIVPFRNYKSDVPFSVHKNKEVLDVDLDDKIKDIIIQYFENWVKNDLVPMFNSLVYTNDNSDTCGINNSVKFFKENTIQSNWLTSLYTSVEYLFFVYHLKDNDKVSITNDTIKHICEKVRIALTTKEENSTTPSIKVDNSSNTDINTSLYYTLKYLYNKWLCGYTAKDWKLQTVEKDIEARKLRFEKLKTGFENSEYNNFIYIDQFYNDISDTFIIDPGSIQKIIERYQVSNEHYYVYQFMQGVAQENDLLFLALPVFNNFYSTESIVNIFSPNNMYGNSNSYLGYGSTYVLIYTSEMSNKSKISNDEKYNFNVDYPDIAMVFDNSPEDARVFGEGNKNKQNYKISAFGVTYSKQNQMYFKRINVGMDNPKITDESIRNQLMISESGKNGDLNNPSTLGQNIYSIYSNRAYTCSVEMMGCMNIMPLMYFQLNNIELFRGAYMITNVRHSIKPGDITTTFTGVRVSKYIYPEVSSHIISETIFNKIKNSKTIKSGKVGDVSNGDKMKKILGGADNIDTNNITKDFVDDNLITKIQVPTWVEDKNGNVTHKWQTIEINKNIVSEVKNIFSLLATGKPTSENYDKCMTENRPIVDYQTVISDTNNEYLIENEGVKSPFIFKTIGTYSFRQALKTDMTPTGKLSWHSFGIAFDINASYNPYIDYTEYNSKVSVKEDTKYHIRTWNHPVVKAFMKNGFGWGIYKSRYDYMHFSYMTSQYNPNTNKTISIHTNAGERQDLLVGH